MTTSVKPDHRLEWTPPERPEWVRRINEEGACMDIEGIVPLDERSLLETAKQATGLSDFGADDWYEPFNILVKSLEEEAELNLMGRLMTRSDLLMILKARLQIEDTYKRHPEIEDGEIRKPLMIIGQGRSGTSFLQNVLGRDPENGGMLHWETIIPCPPPEAETYWTDPRVEKANKLVDQWNRVTPTFTSMHEMAGDIPFEDMAIMGINFMAPSWFDTMGQIPTYDAYMMAPDRDWTPAYMYHQRVLKLLQWKNPRERWVLKDVMHLNHLKTILKIYPDACFVWPHRDPVRSLASLISTVGTIMWMRCEKPFKGESLAYLTDPYLAASRFNQIIDQIEAGEIPEKQIFHMLYRDLVKDTMGTLTAMYEHFGVPLTERGRDGMENYLRESPRDNRPPHRFSIGSPEAVAQARDAFRHYQEYFDIPEE